MATVDYGDGSGMQPLALTDKLFDLNYIYDVAGSYTVTVTVTDDDGGTGLDTLIVTVLSPQGLIDDLIKAVEDLVAGDKLGHGQGNALIAKLEAAKKQLDREKENSSAINELQAFINQVNALISSGDLFPEDGQPLIDAANMIIAILDN